MVELDIRGPEYDVEDIAHTAIVLFQSKEVFQNLGNLSDTTKKKLRRIVSICFQKFSYSGETLEDDATWDSLEKVLSRISDYTDNPKDRKIIWALLEEIQREYIATYKNIQDDTDKVAFLKALKAILGHYELINYQSLSLLETTSGGFSQVPEIAARIGEILDGDE